MTQRSRFWDGTTIGDATVAPYDAGTEFSEVMTAVAGLTSDPNKGGPVSALNVFMFSPGTMRIGPFEALVYGAWYQNDANIDIPIATPAAATRIDTVVLRKDWAAQTVRMFVITGTEGGSAPALVQTPGVTWDVPVATLSTTTGGVTTITPTSSRADFWYRTAPSNIRTDNNIGIGVSVPSQLGAAYRVVQVGGFSMMGVPTDSGSANLMSGVTFNGTEFVSLVNNQPTNRMLMGGGNLWFQTAPGVPLGNNAVMTTRLSVDQNGLTYIRAGVEDSLSVALETRGQIRVGDFTGGGNPAQQRYVRIAWASPSGGAPVAAPTAIELACPNGSAVGIDWHTGNVNKFGMLYGSNQNVFLGQDIGWGWPAGVYIRGGIVGITASNGSFTAAATGHVQLNPGASNWVITNQNGGGYTLPGIDNSTSLGAGNPRWSQVCAVNGTIQTSHVSMKKDFAPLDPLACIEAVLTTDWLSFTYIDPTPPVRADDVDDNEWERIRTEYKKMVVETAPGRKQKGFVLGSDQYHTAEMFGTIDRRSANASSDLAVVACALQHALGELADARERIAILEGRMN